MSGKKSIRVMSLFVITVILFTVISLPVLAESDAPPEVQNVEAVCVINAAKREAVIEKNMKKTVYPASTVKLMTALVAYEHFRDQPETEITVTKEMLDASVGRNLSLSVGERIRATDLLHAMLVGGYNDAAVILAFATAGSIQVFCEEMNAKALELGAVDTYYTNPTGLHDKAMVTTAYDTALVGLAIFEDPTLLAMTKTVKYTIPATNKSEDFTIYNRNTLITTSITEEYYYSYAEGMNSGATDEGGDCVVTGGRLDGQSYVCAVMGGRVTSEEDETNYACIAAKDLLRYALISYEVKTIFSADRTVGAIPVRFSATEESVSVKPSRDLTSLLYIGVDVEKEIQFDIEIFHESLDAPVREGDMVGMIRAIYEGEVIDSTELILTDTIESHGFLVFMYDLKVFTQHPLFIIAIALIVIGIIVLLIRRSPKGGKKDRRKRNRYFDADDFR